MLEPYRILVIFILLQIFKYLEINSNLWMLGDCKIFIKSIVYLCIIAYKMCGSPLTPLITIFRLKFSFCKV